jgi:spore maturation protein CgeB
MIGAMRILTTSFFYYYNDTRGIEPQFYYLFRVPESMGHEVDFFDHPTASKVGVEHMRRVFLNLIKGGKYDVVFVATHKEEFDEETLREARRYVPVIAWNSDDEWRWEEYSSKRVGWYTWMVTNSPEVYAQERGRHGNLLHAQWACTGFWEGGATAKDVDFSFAGMMYGTRKEQVLELNRAAGLAAFGMGAKELGLAPLPNLPEELRDVKLQTTISFEAINGIWNRSRMSFTPLDSSDGTVRQIKSRVFDMGLSGTLMLAHRAPYLDQYYEPGREYVPFETLEECAERARWYLGHESERRRIADAYARRTRGEHLWRHRIEHVLRSAGL